MKLFVLASLNLFLFVATSPSPSTSSPLSAESPDSPLCSPDGAAMMRAIASVSNAAFDRALVVRSKAKAKEGGGGSDVLRIVVIGGSEPAGAECLPAAAPPPPPPAHAPPPASDAAASCEPPAEPSAAAARAVEDLFMVDPSVVGHNRWHKNTFNETLCSWPARLAAHFQHFQHSRRQEKGEAHAAGAIVYNGAIHATGTEQHLLRAPAVFERACDMQPMGARLAFCGNGNGTGNGKDDVGRSIGEAVDVVLLDVGANVSHAQ
jgi:hypothetical protein